MFGKFKTEDEVLAAVKMRRISDSDPADVFVAGYPKSGNTWMQYLLAGAIFGCDARVVPDIVVQDLVPDVHYREYYRRYLTPTFFKTHEFPQPRHRRVVYLVRDGRDVMVSYLHHLTALGKSLDPVKIVAIGEGLFPCRWHEHVEAWTANPYGAEIITISYEGLKKDTMLALQKICHFTGIERDRATLESAVRNSTFEVLREREKKFGWSDPLWPKDKPFIRRGKVGSFKDEMSGEVLSAFMKQSERTMKALGYV
jgi:Sulfotransferase domain